jgi:hypothetical protein
VPSARIERATQGLGRRRPYGHHVLLSSTAFMKQGVDRPSCPPRYTKCYLGRGNGRGKHRTAVGRDEGGLGIRRLRVGWPDYRWLVEPIHIPPIGEVDMRRRECRGCGGQPQTTPLWQFTLPGRGKTESCNHTGRMAGNPLIAGNPTRGKEALMASQGLHRLGVSFRPRVAAA